MTWTPEFGPQALFRREGLYLSLLTEFGAASTTGRPRRPWPDPPVASRSIPGTRRTLGWSSGPRRLSPDWASPRGHRGPGKILGRRPSRLVTRYGRLDLLCLDEFGYVQLDARGAELMFQILTEREEKASVATASNVPFSEWGQVIGDLRLMAAIVDRLTFNATSSGPAPRASGCARPGRSGERS